MWRLSALCGDDIEGGILFYNGDDSLSRADGRTLALALRER